MSTLVLQIEDESIVTQIQELDDNECAFNEEEFVESLAQIKSGEALKNAKPIDDLFLKLA
ncbi:MAG: hypothetical protein U9N49_08320 [Campylobacterota bacterium]|nr:hypothetical protein [Campylobacterota bacterium]